MTNLKELKEKAMAALKELYAINYSYAMETGGGPGSSDFYRQPIEAYITALKAETEKVAREAWEARRMVEVEDTAFMKYQLVDGKPGIDFEFKCPRDFTDWWEKRKG